LKDFHDLAGSGKTRCLQPSPRTFSCASASFQIFELDAARNIGIAGPIKSVTTYWLACSNLIGVALSKKGNCQLGNPDFAGIADPEPKTKGSKKQAGKRASEDFNLSHLPQENEEA
jgi:hypothetical protein